MKKLILLFSLALTFQAQADVASDIAFLRTLAPAGTDVAQIQTEIWMGSSEADAFDVAASNYVITDFNDDHHQDVLVIFEENPKWNGGEMEPGGRTIHFFLGQADGSYKAVSQNNAIVLGYHDGGVWGDPLEGMYLNEKGSVVLSFYGGSAWRWGHSYTFQFRKTDLYVIGLDTMSMYSRSGEYESTSINLLTGIKIQTWGTIEDDADKVRKTKIAKQPLKSLGATQSLME